MLKKITIWFLAVLLALSCLSGCSKPETRVVILYTNDVHCSIEAYADLAAYAAELKARGETVLVADGGDFSQGSALCKIDEGASIIQLMNAVGYDFAVPGNHDYQYGMEALQRNVDAAEFSFLTCEEAEFPHEDFYMMEFGGHRAAFVGIECCEGRELPLDAVQRAVDAAREQGAEVVFAVGHTGAQTEPLIAGTRGIDIYLNAHDHVLSDMGENTLSYPNAEGQSIPVYQTGSKMKYIGRIDLTIGENGFSHAVRMIAPDALMAELGNTLSPEAAKAKEAVEQAIADCEKNAEVLNVVIGTSECTLQVYDPVGFPECVEKNYKEYNSGDFMADAYRAVAGADVAMVNRSDITVRIDEGPVTELALCTAVPWLEDAYVIELTGSQIMEILEQDTKNWPEYTSAEPAVSGMTFCVDTSIAFGQPGRVCDVMIGDAPLELEKPYTVAGNYYYLFNANGLDASQGSVIGLDVEVLETYIVDHLGGVIPASLYGDPAGDGRVAMK